MLTNDIISFEQLDPESYKSPLLCKARLGLMIRLHWWACLSEPLLGARLIVHYFALQLMIVWMIDWLFTWCGIRECFDEATQLLFHIWFWIQSFVSFVFCEYFDILGSKGQMNEQWFVCCCFFRVFFFQVFFSFFFFFFFFLFRFFFFFLFRFFFFFFFFFLKNFTQSSVNYPFKRRANAANRKKKKYLYIFLIYFLYVFIIT